MSVRTALAASLNVPAVRTLGLVGADALRASSSRRLGFDGLREAGDFYGPSLALGSADVSLWELVNAYRALAARRARGARSRLGADEPAGDGAAASTPTDAAFLVSDILADRESRSLTFGLENPLATRFWTAVKTGTSKDMRDNWCVGYSRRYTVGVWVGNFSGEPMRDVSGVTGAAPVWLEVMAWLHARGAERAARAAGRGGRGARGVPRRGRAGARASGSSPAPSRRRRRRPSPAGAPAHHRAGRRHASSRSTPTSRRAASACVFEATDARESAALGARRRRSRPRARAPCLAPRPRPARAGAGRRPRALVDRVSFEVRGVPRAAHAEPGR